ncbi:Alginate lyase 2 [Catenulispora acidiphila DSM 44928]|uniref:Alginate lyase 2 n=1 Tax=Catenulispora acidiphila (strain DSM 44928 / JCM 14897 / NBRC 102108 / NRRL B-24433 / ID139908) TaxID=479433 RepID=C7QB25_CATAD|nr:polysaccharide lyase family 7 protein [Catenulispora acidiphila]ACU76316.1 Alginate lyase 2 [Catenulispora acidiphila DSM 44928]
MPTPTPTASPRMLRKPRRRSARSFAAAFGSVALTVAGTSLMLAPVASAGNATGQVTGYQGLCLDDRGGLTANLNPVQVYSCNGTTAQQWTVNSTGNTLQVLGKCLDVHSAGTANGTTVDLYDCNGSGAQVWVPQSNGELLNPNSGKCLDDTGHGGSGTQAQIWSCTGSTNQQWTLPTGSGGGTGPGGLNPGVAPGGNFDLSLWELQLPTGSAGSPTTILPAQLEGANGYQSQYFYTDSTDGAMTFWDPENGVTTPNSNYSRSEFREMTSSGAAANWFAAGTTNTLSATLKVTQVPDHVCVGQIHLGSGGSTKPLLELFYYASGDIKMAIEQTPAGGNEVLYDVGTVPVGTQFSYVIGLSGSTISLSLNGGAARTWTASSTFNGYGMYFKAGDYDQSSGSSSSVGARVGFYALSIHHS